MDEDLVAILSAAKHLPKEALKRAVAQPETVAAPVLRVLEAAANDPDQLSDPEVDLLFWGLHALAAARDTRVFEPLLRLLRHDSDTLDSVLGDAVTTTLARIIASSFDGDTEALHRLILDSTIDSFVRNETILALTFLAREGRVSRDETRDLLVRFDEKKVAVEEDVGWAGWEEAIAYLGLADLVPRVDAARRDGRLPGEFTDPVWFRKALRRVQADPADVSEFDDIRYGYLDDPVTALAWTAEGAGQPVKNPFKDVGRNDPCPCGSGKKYKKCCLDAAAITASPPLLPGLH